MVEYVKSCACENAKTGSYFVMHLVVAVLVAFAITGSWAIAIGIGLAEPIAQTVCYHFHEKIWAKYKKHA